MSLPNRQLQQQYPNYDGKDQPLDVPLVRKIISSTMPELMDGSNASVYILDKIQEYLFEQPFLKTARLESLINEELLIMLYGLKRLLQKHHLNFIDLFLDNHQHQFVRWLREELDEMAGHHD